ncbi:MAG: triple tyrosine motif-containing protein [Chitinophagaceae bacterium]
MRTLLLLIFLPQFLLGQNTIGLPDITNFTRELYSAGLQNWDIKQDKNGVLYVANNEGLLTFDGRNWNLYPLPNKTNVRSVEISDDNHIYVGGQDEMGYFSPSKNGKLEYHSLTGLIPAKDKSFGDVWDIVSFNKHVFFRTINKIFKLTNQAIITFNAPLEWAFLGSCKKKLYAQDYKTGIMEFENDVWVPISAGNILPFKDPITSILSVNSDSILLTTLKNGLYWLKDGNISELQSSNNDIFRSARIYAAAAINGEWVALATNNKGVYIIDLKGNLIQSFSSIEGLQNNNVLSIFLDNQSNLWLGLDNGIDLVAYNSAIKQINPMSQDGSGYTSIISGGRLYTGTSNGLYSVPLQPMQDLSFSKGDFEPVAKAKGQTWGLASINNELLLGQHEGFSIVKNNAAQTVSSDHGFWTFVPLSGTFPAEKIVAGNYQGLVFFDYKNGGFKVAGQVPDFTESSRFVAIDNNDNIWVSHPYHGVYKVSRNAGGLYKWQLYTDQQGLPSLLNNHVYKIKNEVLVASEKGVYVYNTLKDRFEPSSYYQKIFGDQSLRYLKEDPLGNIWFIHDKILGVADFTTKQPTIIYLPELNNKMLSGFECIYAVDEKNIFLGGEKGFYHINYEKYKKSALLLRVQVRAAKVSGNHDSLYFGGYFKDINEPQTQDAAAIPQIKDGWKTIRLEYAASLFGYQSNLEYSYRLKGFDESWSSWARQTEKEYTNLPAGNFTFEVKVRNNLGTESAVAGYSFKILPPWYLSIWAKCFYLMFLAASIYSLYARQMKKFKLQQAKYEAEQQRLLYIHELELNKTASELVALKNEKLEADINFKNSELGSSAMHLVKKGELLSKIKAELAHVSKGIEKPEALADLKKMIKTLNEDENMDKEWENFSTHFDKVHSDFLVALKEKHPAITPTELKLSAYLRMNLSTKEIAQLMNISVRGVEISRYRLRKKLALATEMSLFDYLIDVQAKK